MRDVVLFTSKALLALVSSRSKGMRLGPVMHFFNFRKRLFEHHKLIFQQSCVLCLCFLVQLMPVWVADVALLSNG